MKSLEKAPKAPAASKAAKKENSAQPITITIKGKLARKVRDASKWTGVPVETLAETFIEYGEHLCGSDAASKDFREMIGAKSVMFPAMLPVSMARRLNKRAAEAGVRPEVMGGEILREYYATR